MGPFGEEGSGPRGSPTGFSAFRGADSSVLAGLREAPRGPVGPGEALLKPGHAGADTPRTEDPRMAQYIAKRQVPVRISQPELVPFDGCLWLAPQSGTHAGHETILELLNSSLNVIPVHRPGEEAVLLATRLNLDWVMATDIVDPSLVCPPTYWVTREERVKVTFIHGGSMDGLIRMELPPEINRPSDFLNGPEDFFPLVTRMGILLANKQRVREMSVYQATPAAPQPQHAGIPHSNL